MGQVSYSQDFAIVNYFITVFVEDCESQNVLKKTF